MLPDGSIAPGSAISGIEASLGRLPPANPGHVAAEANLLHAAITAERGLWVQFPEATPTSRFSPAALF